MNRRTLIASAAVLPLGACGTNTTGLPTDWQALVDQIQAGVAVACGFLPSVASVLALLGMGAPPAIVAMICGALSPPGVAAATPHYPGAKRTVTVAGKPISGVFLR